MRRLDHVRQLLPLCQSGLGWSAVDQTPICAGCTATMQRVEAASMKQRQGTPLLQSAGGPASFRASFHTTTALHSQAQTAAAVEDTSARASDVEAANTPPPTEDDAFLQQAQRVTEGPLATYAKGRLDGLYRKDERQEAAMMALQRLYDELQAVTPKERRRPSGLTMVDNIDNASKGRTAWWQGLSKFIGGSPEAAPQAPRLRGLYMYGGVGVGKTMLMDVFAHASPPEFKVLRSHFHDFMLEVHAQLRVYSSHQDPLAQVACNIVRSTKVLCLDEFFVTDVADAAMLNRLFGHMWDRGLVLVATSNRSPDALYEGGLQRNLFLPFIARLKKETVVHDMASPTDYRKLAHHRRGLYFTPVDFPDPSEELERRFSEMTASHTVAPARIQVMMGRYLDIPQAGGPVARFDFDTLCGRPVAAADYIALVGSYHTLMLSGVPIFNAANRSPAYRFQTLIDVLYEHRVRLFCSAEGQPWELFDNVVTQTEGRIRRHTEGDEDLVIDDNLGFAKERSISRLTEMQSLEYLTAHAELHAPELLLALQEAAALERSSKRNQPRRKN
ncbi:hypothetical protein WJX72_004055 [[Myrmecia] bisecta]|uniref:AFG1-like ATPase n=1 Tax=[Myrmecia] bisecta TaxID=41462 RepID=A0AAW1R6W5_9CHLO